MGQMTPRDPVMTHPRPDRVTGHTPIGVTLVTRSCAVTRSQMSEADLQRGISDMARVLGWRVAHFRPARTARGWRTPVSADGAGFPDLVLTRGSRVIAAELKTSTGRLSPDQTAWLDALSAAGVPALVWRPADYPDAIAAVLA